MQVEFIGVKLAGKQECLSGKLTTVLACTSATGSRLFPGNVGRRDLHSRRFHTPDFSSIFRYCPVAGKLARARNVLDYLFSPLSWILGRKQAICWKVWCARSVSRETPIRMTWFTIYGTQVGVQLQRKCIS